MEDQQFILECVDINKSFSTVKVLEDVSLRLRKGSILGLCGENGAGKSTLMNILGGIYDFDSGTILLGGEVYKPRTPADAQNAGIAFIHQELNLFLNLTVKQNFMIENLPQKGIFRLIDTKKIREKAEASISKLGEEIDIESKVEDLNIGHRQLVEIAKEISKNVQIVIFDEPTTSLSNKEKEKLFKVINDMVSHGISVIYISHILDDVCRLCNDIVVLRDGKTVYSDVIDNFSKDRIVNYMVGREITNFFPYVEKNVKEEIFRVGHIVREGRLSDITFSLKKGEIVGMFGLMGAGRSELVRAIFGLDKMDSGTVYVDNRKIEKPNPIVMKNMGVAFVTENRHDEGLLMSKSLRENMTLTYLRNLKKRNGLVDNVKEKKICEQQIKKLKIKTYDYNRQTAVQFSGGNQQKIVLAKWLVTEPKIFILDEPTRGVDVGAKYEIYDYMNHLAVNDSAILFISSEMEELIGVCDRILVMSKGRLIGELKREEYQQSSMLKMAIEGVC